MTTAPGARSEPTSVRIIDAATNQFFERGYHGTSIKELAAEAGVRSATLYYHFPSKEEILVAIMRSTLTDLAEVVETTTIPEHGAVDQLRTAVTTHIRFHVDHHREVFLCDAELRALSPTTRAEIVAQRDRYEGIFRGILQSGLDAGVLDVPDVELVTRSLLAACSGVAFWFRPGGRMTVTDIADTYAEIFLRALRPTTA
jgi:AcrR family transcriptional regulator